MSFAAIASIVFAAVVTAALAVLGWLGRGLLHGMMEVRDGQRDLRALLVGYDGKNGIRSEVERLRGANHERSNQINALTGRVALVEFRIEHLEEAKS